MKVAEVLDNIHMSNYSVALTSNEPTKNCVSLSRAIYQSHDSLYRVFNNPIEDAKFVSKDLLRIAQENFSKDGAILVFDDSQISKPHASEIEGLDITYDGSSGRPELGIQFVSALLTDGDLKIPVQAEQYVTKAIGESYYKTKSKVAEQIYKDLVNVLIISLVLADAHYAVKEFLLFLASINQQFLMKFPRNRAVEIDGKIGPIQDVLRLKRNEHCRVKKGILFGKEFYFYVVKVSREKTVYLISLHQIDRKKVSKLYKIRWGVELFHRTAKKHLGWKDCQMRASEKQKLHTYYVMHTYAIAELVRIKMKLKTTEEAIREIWDVKKPSSILSLEAMGEHLC